jgi:hypothetical protein
VSIIGNFAIPRPRKNEGSSTMRTLSRFGAFAICLLAAFAVPAAAHAAGSPVRAVAATCGGSSSYPPTVGATVQASSLNVRINETIEVSGNHFCANENVRITLGSTLVGTGHTNGSGSFDPAVKVTGPVGATKLCGTGASGVSTDVSCIAVNVQAAAAGGGSSGGSSGGTAFTGTEIGLLVGVGVVLLGGGVAFAAAGRRRKTALVG